MGLPSMTPPFRRKIYDTMGVQDRVRRLMAAWVGPALTPRQIAALVALEGVPHSLHQALHRAVQDGLAHRVGHGLYLPATGRERADATGGTDTGREGL